MRKLQWSLIAIVLVIIAACSTNNKEKETDTDSVVVVNLVEEPVDTVEEPDFFLTAERLGSIMVEMPVKEIPKDEFGLFDTVTIDQRSIPVLYSFYKNDGLRFTGYDFGEGLIDMISVESPEIKIKSPVGELGIGDPFLSLLSIPGMESEWIETDNDGMWYWHWHGLWFAPTQKGLTKEFVEKLYNMDEGPVRADFTEDITIGYIGTGLPF